MVRNGFDGLATLNRLQREMDRLFGDALGGAAFPALNAWEDADAVTLEAELPGVALEDVEINLHQRELTLRGARKPAAGEGKPLHQERFVGGFERRVTLPFEVDGDRVAARLADGVLTVTLPKAASAKPRRITVS